MELEQHGRKGNGKDRYFSHALAKIVSDNSKKHQFAVTLT
jgi:hypothetical protein